MNIPCELSRERIPMRSPFCFVGRQALTPFRAVASMPKRPIASVGTGTWPCPLWRIVGISGHLG